MIISTIPAGESKGFPLPQDPGNLVVLYKPISAATLLAKIRAISSG